MGAKVSKKGSPADSTEASLGDVTGASSRSTHQKPTSTTQVNPDAVQDFKLSVENLPVPPKRRDKVQETADEFHTVSLQREHQKQPLPSVSQRDLAASGNAPKLEVEMSEEEDQFSVEFDPGSSRQGMAPIHGHVPGGVGSYSSAGQSAGREAEQGEKTSKIEWQRGELVGAGAFGRVYLGMNNETGELMAVKQVAIYPGVGASQDKAEEHVAALEAEVAVLQHLSHPNIVRYLGTQRDSEFLNIFLEYVPGGSIAQLLNKFGPFNERIIRMYTRQLLQGLEFLHRHQIMHRDVKGANLLVDNNGIVKLADFGASKRVEDLATYQSGHKSMKGTPYWMAPEVIKQTGHGRQADIWSVGCTVIEMATGKPPWSEFQSSISALFHIASSTSTPPLPEHLSTDAIDFLTLCFIRNPKERPGATSLLQHSFILTQVPPTPEGDNRMAANKPRPFPPQSKQQPDEAKKLSTSSHNEDQRNARGAPATGPYPLQPGAGISMRSDRNSEPVWEYEEPSSPPRSRPAPYDDLSPPESIRDSSASAHHSYHSNHPAASTTSRHQPHHHQGSMDHNMNHNAGGGGGGLGGGSLLIPSMPPRPPKRPSGLPPLEDMHTTAMPSNPVDEKRILDFVREKEKREMSNSRLKVGSPGYGSGSSTSRGPSGRARTHAEPRAGSSAPTTGHPRHSSNRHNPTTAQAQGGGGQPSRMTSVSAPDTYRRTHSPLNPTDPGYSRQDRKSLTQNESSKLLLLQGRTGQTSSRSGRGAPVEYSIDPNFEGTTSSIVSRQSEKRIHTPTSPNALSTKKRPSRASRNEPNRLSKESDQGKISWTNSDGDNQYNKQPVDTVAARAERERDQAAQKLLEEQRLNKQKQWEAELAMELEQQRLQNRRKHGR